VWARGRILNNYEWPSPPPSGIHVIGGLIVAIAGVVAVKEIKLLTSAGHRTPIYQSSSR